MDRTEISPKHFIDIHYYLQNEDFQWKVHNLVCETLDQHLAEEWYQKLQETTQQAKTGRAPMSTVAPFLVSIGISVTVFL